MLEMIKNFFKRLFGKDKKLIEEATKEYVEEVQENVPKVEVVEINESKKEDLPPINDDTDMFEYMQGLIKGSSNYNRLIDANDNYEKAKADYEELIEKVKKMQE